MDGPSMQKTFPRIFENGNAVPASQHLCLETWAQVFWEFFEVKKVNQKPIDVSAHKVSYFPTVNTSIFRGGLMRHTTYSWNIKWQKCAGISVF